MELLTHMHELAMLGDGTGYLVIASGIFAIFMIAITPNKEV